MRMFIGVALSRLVRRHIASAVGGPAGTPGMRAVPPENLHITLDFLGEVDQSRIKDIVRVMQQAVQGSAPVPISTGNTGRFGQGLLYLSIHEGAAALAGIKDKLDAGLESIGVSFEDKPYRPHITLARKADARVRIDIAPVSFEAGGITLFQSARAKYGQVYTPVAEAAFTEGRLRIDRIEGAFAVCENSGGGMVDIAIADLPFQAAERMLIYKDGAAYTILERGIAKSLKRRIDPDMGI